MAGLGGGSGGGGAGKVRAGSAYVELFAEDNRVYRALDKLKGRLQSFGGTLAKAGAGLGAAGLAGLAPLKPALDTLQGTAKIGDAAEAFGLSAEAASRLFGIMAAGGSDIRDATEGIVTFNQRVEDGMSGTGEEAAKLFAGLGKSAGSFTGDSADKFYQLLDALRQVPDPAKRVQLLLKAVGEDTGKNLIPLLSMSADEVRGLGDAFEQSGADIKAARETNREYTKATAGLGKVWREAVAAVAPVIKEVAELVSKYAKPAAEFVGRNREAVATLLSLAGGLAAGGAALIAFGVAASAIGTAIGAAVLVVKGLAIGIAAILSPVGLAVIAVTALVGGLGYLFSQTEAGAGFFAWLGSGFESIAKTASEAWGGIATALGRGDLKGAFEVAVAGINVVWQELVHTLTYAWIGFKMILLDGFDKFVDTAVAGFMRLGIQAAKVLTRGLQPVFTDFAALAGLIGQTDIQNALGRVASLGNATDAQWATLFRNVDGWEEKREKERRDARLKEIKAADDAFAGARGGFADKIAATKIPIFGDAVGGGAAALMKLMAMAVPAVEQTAKMAGSRGTFGTSMLGQRFGTETIDKQQLKAAQQNVIATQNVEKACVAIAKGLTFK